MSKVLHMPERSTSTRNISPAGLSPPPQTSKSRVLACVRCGQRKVRCDRKFPCANCIKSRTQCVPATLATRRRRRKFSERELLERLRKYEDLLRQNNIKFEPLSKNPSGENRPLNAEGGYDSDDEHREATGVDWPSPPTTIKSNRVYESKDIWRSLHQEFRDPDNDSNSSYDDDAAETVVTRVWDEYIENNDHLLFGLGRPAIELSALHPEAAQIFRLWQIYLENVNPLLKVTHTPSLQGRIVEAASNVQKNISPTLEALMFSIYSMAILSLVADDVQAMFGSSKEDLLSTYQFGCQQALMNCSFLRCDDRDCLTALYLYLVSIRPKTAPRTLSSILGVAIRIAERMGIHKESELAKCTVPEAEMRRRLWWSLVLFDTRIGELAFYKTTNLAPTWDCEIPLNVNDYDLRAEMKEPPEVLGKSTEALFAVVRGELGDAIRNTMFYLDFTAPALKPLAKDVQNGTIPEGGELVALEKMIEDKYLKSYDPENPLQFMTIWTARAFLAKYRFMEHHSKYSGLPQTEAQRDAAISLALNRLECDTKLKTSPIIRGFHWLLDLDFPFPAYLQIVQEFKRRPISEQAKHAWAVMSDNYEARFSTRQSNINNPFHKIFSRNILQAWEACEVASRQLGESLTPPGIVLSIRHIMGQTVQNVQDDEKGQPQDDMGMVIDDFLMSMPMDFGGQMYSTGTQAGHTEMGPGIYPHTPGRAPLDVDLSQLDWSVVNWNSMNGTAGPAEPYPHIPGQVPFDTDTNQLDSPGGLAFGAWPLGG